MAFKALILLLTLISFYIEIASSNGYTKIWTSHETKFINFENDDLDCINQTFIYQKHAGAYFSVPEQVNTIILPSSGAIVFPENHQIQFIPKQSKCHSEGYNVKHFKLHLNQAKSWFDPNSWRVKDKSPNKATPLIDRIPCECDIVEFPTDRTLWVHMGFIKQLTVNQVKINGKVNNFNDFLRTDLGQSMFLEAFEVSESFCEDSKSCGCHETSRFEEYSELVCLNADVCKEPECIDPILPIGNCCPICGAMMQYYMNETFCKSEIKYNNEALELGILKFEDGKYANKVEGYVGMGRGKEETDIGIQIVFVDKDKYTGISNELVKLLSKEKFYSHYYSPHLIYAGRPHDPNQSTSVWFVVFGSLLFVVSIYGTIYAYYADDSKLRKYNPLNRFRLFSSPFVFARFENNRDGDTDSIAVGVDFDANPNPSTSIYETIASAFDNPMFKRRNKEKKIETIGPNAFNVCSDDDGDTESVTSVKLVEVGLDSET